MSETRNIFITGWKKRLFIKVLDCYHLLLRRLCKKHFKGGTAPPRRILLCKWGGFGDVVIALRVIPHLKRAFPGCQIGVLVHTHAKMAAEKSSHVDFVHHFDMKLFSSQTLLGRLCELIHFAFFVERRLAKKIQSIGYDLALDLCFFYPHAISTMWKAKIPMRLGFDHAGYSFLLTRSISHPEALYFPFVFTALLKELGISCQMQSRPFAPRLSPNIPKSPYILLHPFSRETEKEFAPSLWNQLYELFREQGHEVYVTGAGSREKPIADEIVADPSYNLCNRLQWEEWVQAIGECALLVSVDTASVHIAAEAGAPLIVLYKSTPNIDFWRPNQSLAFVQTDPYPYLGKRKDGKVLCRAELDAKEIFKESLQVLRNHESTQTDRLHSYLQPL